jgi:hypothetical protein
MAGGKGGKGAAKVTNKARAFCRLLARKEVVVNSICAR